MSTPLLTAGVRVPAGPHAPLRLDFDLHALRTALLSREAVAALDAGVWEKPGVYVLVGGIAYGEKTEVRVGQSVQLKSRLTAHVRTPPIAWWRALAVIRDTTVGFHSAQIRYIEGALADELRARPGVKLFEGQRDADTTLPTYERTALDAFVQTILEALKIVGITLVSPADAGAEEEEISKAGTTHTRVAGTISDLLAAGILSAGDVLEARQKNRATHETRLAQAEVLASGQLRVDGVSYSSPSTALTRGLDISAGNGWIGWKVAGSATTLADLRDRLEPQRPT
ncbi:restriction system modified-DNA reader domain-containing protein [Patulibacter sp. S7RM1-6]